MVFPDSPVERVTLVCQEGTVFQANLEMTVPQA